MTTDEAKQILIGHNKWRRGRTGPVALSVTCNPKIIGIAIDILTQNKPRTALSQSIYDAAVNWPQYLGDVECRTIAAFLGCCEVDSYNQFHRYLIGELGSYGKEKSRMFMLFVAEALND